MGGEPVLALEHAEARIGPALEQLPRDREPEDAAADDDEVAVGGRVGHVGQTRWGRH